MTVSDFVFTGTCWKVGDYIPTDQIVKSHRVFEPMEVIARHVLEDANPRFAPGVQPGDVLVAGQHFGQSSGRAIAAKAVKATGVGCVVAECFSRTFFRNGYEIGLPILELPGVTAAVEEGDTLTVDIEAGTLFNERTGQTLQGRKTDPFLLDMLRGGGLIPIAGRLVAGASAAAGAAS
jgi:3-isopropylmalate/(R)-2-methylmalate dehydratase small subunit